jgi:hypothetical protein
VSVDKGRCIDLESLMVQCQCRLENKSDEEAKKKQRVRVCGGKSMFIP